MRFRIWLEGAYEDALKQYEEKEPLLLKSPQISQELSETGRVKIRTIQQVLGVPEGDANFIAREFNKRHENLNRQSAYSDEQKALEMREKRDEYYYHVLPSSKLRKISKEGLLPNQAAVFSNYKGHSRGRIFLSEKEGVNFWKHRVEDHLFHNGQPTDVSVVRVSKDLVKVKPDNVGTQDSRSPSYFLTTPIPPEHIEIVQGA